MTIQSKYATYLIAIILCCCAVASPRAAAFGTDVYAANSRLASGRWVKISVASTGLYRLPTATLREWGFSDPSRVRIYGYGTWRGGDVLTASTYIDDLPPVQAELTERGLVFWAVGPDRWRMTVSGRYVADYNQYTTAGYYFVTEVAGDEAAPAIDSSCTAGATNPAKEFDQRLHHEQELTSVCESGLLLVGEDFRYTPRRTFDFAMPGRVAGDTPWLECSFVAHTLSGPSNLTFTANGAEQASVSSDRILPTINDNHYHGTETVARHTLELPDNSDKLRLEIAHNSSVVVYGAWLNYISINYRRALELPAAGYLPFWMSQRSVSLGTGGVADVRVWDVSNPSRITVVNTADNAGRAEWTTSAGGWRDYVAWHPAADIPVPEMVGVVANQNLHAVEQADMIIFTRSQWDVQAERIAAMHRAEGLSVEVVDVRDVYNEFSSGTPDISGLRGFAKMLYDRGTAAGRPLRYALLMGRATYDNRALTASTRSLGLNTIPVWGSTSMRMSLSDNDGYTTDDFLAMLADGAGQNQGSDRLCIAVGRIPVTSATEAKTIVDKLYRYNTSAKKTPWKNRVMALADDEDQGEHLRQTEKFCNNIMDSEHWRHVVDKVYLDAYTKSGGEYPEARKAQFSALDEGVEWWHFVGHANNHSWTSDGQLTYRDINNMFLRNIPFVSAVTCDFLRWDSNTISGGEIMFFEPYGGCIGMISAVRPVFIADNAYFTAALGRYITARNDDGRMLTAGEVYQHAKNDIRNNDGEHISNTNRLRFVFMGDPALRRTTPDNVVTVDAIDGIAADIELQPTLAALQRTTVSGRITRPDGTAVDDFDGVVTIDIYDADRSVTSNGNGDGKRETFDTHGNKLFSGSAPVKGGRYELSVAMPSEIADNFRPATMSAYAYATNSNDEAVGASRDFYVYGLDESNPVDDTPPVIESLVLNHSSFRSGDAVNPSPMLIAVVSDDVGINLSDAGVGHNITATLDGNRTYTDLAQYYTANADGTPGGTINYSFSDLVQGSHTLRLRVFDTSGNSAEATIEFYVDPTLAPQIYDVYTDSSPASVEANFYLTHNRPDGLVTVSVTVYNLMGCPVWTGTQTGMSDMFTSVPVTWDLCDSAGRRVTRGIYLYRATINTEGSTIQTASRKIAVTAY